VNAAHAFPDANEVARRVRNRKRGAVLLTFNINCLPAVTRRILKKHAKETGRSVEEVARRQW
jgi:hypothetical protein